MAVCGLSYASVPLYRLFCQKTGFGGTVKGKDDVDYQSRTKPNVKERVLTIKFNSDVVAGMPWKFVPVQTEVKVVPGEAALAFFTATNLTDQAITGVSTYNVQPDAAGSYFNKIQCFCFEEQCLQPNEQVDMPVFFFIDPDMLEDPALQVVDTITLHYTFFKAGQEDQPLPTPSPIVASA